MKQPLPFPCLCLVTDRHRCRGRSLEEVARQAVEGGVDLVQLREKDLPEDELMKLAEKLRALTVGRALLAVNTTVKVALAVSVDALHLPEVGMSVSEARRQVGKGMLVGQSVHSLASALQAEAAGADYLIAGTLFTTASKDVAPHGVQFLKELCSAVTVPVLGIGGITSGNASSVLAAGAQGVAVVSAISEASDPEAAAAALWQVLQGSRRSHFDSVWRRPSTSSGRTETLQSVRGEQACPERSRRVEP